MKLKKGEIFRKTFYTFWGFWTSFMVYDLTELRGSMYIAWFIGAFIIMTDHYCTPDRHLYLLDKIKIWACWALGGSLLLFVI